MQTFLFSLFSDLGDGSLSKFLYDIRYVDIVDPHDETPETGPTEPVAIVSDSLHDMIESE
jgi:hypothetical protein